jgi:TIR domain-containing protein
MTGDHPPRVFLSYSHESDHHRYWVRRLAEDLTKNGVETTLDQWHLHVGDDIGAFMEQSLEKATYIVLVCTETFAQKANERSGGVGYEQAVFVGELLMNRQLSPRFLPVLRSGDPSKGLPLYLRSRLFVDFRDDDAYGRALDQLLRRIFVAPAFTPPQLGEAPRFRSGDTSLDSALEGRSRQATGVGARRAWVLVAGTGGVRHKLDDKLQQTSMALGASLARSGYGIVTGGWPGVDEVTARSFARELERDEIPLEDRLLQVVVDEELPAFPAGNLVLVHRGEEEWTESVQRAEAVVLIGGIGGTWKTGEYALKFGRVVLPLADTGGDAAKFYMHMQRNWKPEFAPGIDKSKFQLVAREAPQVVGGLIKLLDEWKNQRVRT